jgi:hypothetical protein
MPLTHMIPPVQSRIRVHLASVKIEPTPCLQEKNVDTCIDGGK